MQECVCLGTKVKDGKTLYLIQNDYNERTYYPKETLLYEIRSRKIAVRNISIDRASRIHIQK